MERSRVTKVLDGISWGLVALIALMVVTGGTSLSLGRVKLELSSLDPWMLALAALIGVRRKWAGKSSPVWQRWTGLVTRLTEPGRARLWGVRLLVAVLGTLFVAHVLRHVSLHTDGLDVSYLHQPLYHPLSPRLLTCDVCVAGTYLGEHLGFSLLLLAPFVQVAHWIGGGDFWIFGFQVILIGGAIWFAAVRGVFRKTPALVFAAILLAVSHRSLRAAAVWDFREDVLAFAALMFCALGLVRGKGLLYGISLGVALLSKEIVCLIVPFLAVPILKDSSLPLKARQRKLWASLTVFAGVLYTAIAFRVLFPFFNPYAPGAQQIAARLAEYGSTPSAVLINILTSPSAWWSILSTKILTAAATKYLLLLILPLAYFLRRSPWWLLPALPGIGMNLIGIPNQRTLQFHYDLVVLPFLLTGAWLGMMKTGKQRLAVGLFVALTFSGRWPVLLIQKNWPSLAEFSDSRFLQGLPFNRGPRDESETVAASFSTLAQLSAVSNTRVFRNTSPDNWQKFLESNSIDFSGIPGRSVRQADVWVLDEKDLGQRGILELVEAGKVPGWHATSRSSTRRFGVIEKKRP